MKSGLCELQVVVVDVFWHCTYRGHRNYCSDL